MAELVIMPKQGNTVESCILTKWFKQKGDTVAKGEPLFAYETDKSAFEENAPADGVMLAVLAEENDDVPCLQGVCVIGQPGEDISALLAQAGVQAEPQAPAPAAAAPAAAAPAPVAPAAAPQAAAELPEGVQVVIMPKQGNTVESCILTRWLKQVGDAVAEGDPLFAYETDKSAFEENSPVAGTLLAQLAQEGDDVPVIDPVALVGPAGTDVSAVAASMQAAATQDTPAPVAPAAQAAPAAPVAPAAPAADAGRPSPRARALAERMGLDANLAVPTGPKGRVIERDIYALADGVQRAATGDYTAYTEVKLTNIRRVIAKAMHASLAEMAQLTHHASADATRLQAARAQLKAQGSKINLNDMMLYLVARTLKAHPDLNAHFMGTSMRHFAHVNLGMAVDTERGLLVPTLFGADSMTLTQLAQSAKSLAEQCKSGAISPDSLTGGTFTVSNLGVMGVEMFTPVINPPQTGILGVCAIVDRPRLKKNGFEIYPAIGLSLTYDHRALDGAPASRFLMDLKTAIENFNLEEAL